MVKSYKELTAYQKAYQLVVLIYKMTSSFPKAELYGLTSQMRRSAVSIPSNMAEGYMRGSKEYTQFLKIALGSAAELETQLSLSKDLGFCGDGIFNEVYGLNQEVIKLLRTYIKKMRIRR
ncbi:MAG: four helix bundle protein [Deltaproteobacteria bacterium]|jgi:four helix bundle protein|nr:four helix bundle protein [Deltaproteobacteria bacterium]